MKRKVILLAVICFVMIVVTKSKAIYFGGYDTLFHANQQLIPVTNCVFTGNSGDDCGLYWNGEWIRVINCAFNHSYTTCGVRQADLPL